MALIQTGGGVVNISGSVGGNTYSRNRFGRYMRQKSIPVNPNTAGQQSVRNALGALTTIWSSTLTAVQRTAWNLYASNVDMLNKLGETINLTGFNHFIRSNLEYLRQFSATINAGPVVFELPGQDGTFAITASEATQQISVVHDVGMPWADEDGAAMFLYQGVPQNGQRNFFGGPFEFLANIPGINGAPAGSPSLHAVVKAIAEGQRQWCYARIVRADGRLSTEFRADCLVAA